LALWLNASIAAQKAAQRSASLFVGIIFSFMLQMNKAIIVPRAEGLSSEHRKFLSIIGLSYRVNS
jgi:hypothetical protein